MNSFLTNCKAGYSGFRESYSSQEPHDTVLCLAPEYLKKGSISIGLFSTFQGLYLGITFIRISFVTVTGQSGNSSYVNSNMCHTVTNYISKELAL